MVSQATTNCTEIPKDYYKYESATPDFTILYRIESSDMAPVLLIEVKTISFNETRTCTIHELPQHLFSPVVQKIALSTMKKYYAQFAMQARMFFAEHPSRQAVNMMMICGPYFRRYKVHRPEHLDNDAKILSQLHSNKLKSALFLKKDCTGINDTFIRVWEEICGDVGLI